MEHKELPSNYSCECGKREIEPRTGSQDAQSQFSPTRQAPLHPLENPTEAGAPSPGEGSPRRPLGRGRQQARRERGGQRGPGPARPRPALSPSPASWVVPRLAWGCGPMRRRGGGGEGWAGRRGQAGGRGAGLACDWQPGRLVSRRRGRGAAQSAKHGWARCRRRWRRLQERGRRGRRGRTPGGRGGVREAKGAGDPGRPPPRGQRGPGQRIGQGLLRKSAEPHARPVFQFPAAASVRSLLVGRPRAFALAVSVVRACCFGPAPRACSPLTYVARILQDLAGRTRQMQTRGGHGPWAQGARGVGGRQAGSVPPCRVRVRCS